MSTISPTHPTYRHSGKVPALALFGSLATILIAAFIAGAVFANAEVLLHQLPFPKIRLILIFAAMIFFALVMGIFPIRTLRFLKGRSNRAAILLGLTSAAAGLYFAWIFWLLAYDRAFAQHTLTLAQLIPPNHLFSHIAALPAQNPWHSFGDDTGNIVALPFFWITEALIVSIVATVAAGTVMDSGVFCETCNRWGVTRELMQIDGSDSVPLRTALAHASIDPLLTPKPKSADAPWCDITLLGCPTCDNLQSLSVIRTVSTLNPDGTVKNTAESLVDGLMLHPEQTAALILAAAAMQPITPADATPPAPNPA